MCGAEAGGQEVREKKPQTWSLSRSWGISVKSELVV